MSAVAISVELNTFYRIRHENDPLENLTRITAFSHKKLGEHSDHNCKLKGGECWVFLLFLNWKMQSLMGTRFMTARLKK